jgi:molybdate transport system substrate-binding protein
MRKSSVYVAAGCAALMALLPAAVGGSEIKAFISIGVQSAVEELIPVFEKESAHRLIVTWAIAAGLNKRLQDGEAADLLISTRAGIDGLIKEGKILAGSDAELARSGIGVAVRKGAPKPDISTPEALRRTLLAGRSISYSDPAAGGASGVHFGNVLERLGIAGEMKARTRFPPPNGLSGRLLVSGEADLAIQQIPELASVEGVELVGPLPGDLQLITVFVAGVPATAKQADAAKAFVRFLQSPQAVAIMKAKGLEVPTPAR